MYVTCLTTEFRYSRDFLATANDFMTMTLLIECLYNDHLITLCKSSFDNNFEQQQKK